MTKKAYENKLKPIIQLPQFEKYINQRKNAKHPILKEEERIVDILTELKKENKITTNLYNQLKPRGSQAPRMYGLAKVHKANTPLRPIVSMPGSAYQNVAKQVADWLSHVPECRINSSTQIVNSLLKNTHLQEDECLISFDVSSLYTNVPVKEAIQVCCDLLFSKVDMPIDKETLITLASISSCDVIFNTHDGFYKQIDGLAMGSPPAPHLANGWLSSFDNIIKGSSKLYTRYMDDILCTIKKDNIESHLSMINNLHPSLVFTYEVETNGKLPFLDMKICNNNGSLSSHWYRKPTDTGLTLNFHALAPLKYKKSVVVGFIHRIYRACSSWSHFHDSITEAKDVLINNQYPLDFVESLINSTLKSILVCSDDTINTSCHSESSESCDNNISLDSNACFNQFEEKDKFKFFINYRGKLTEKLAVSFKKLNAPCRLIMTMKKTKFILPSLKPFVPDMLRNNVVYKIQCPRCQSSYVGQTTRHLQQRFKEHIGNKGPVKTHFENCAITPTHDVISILGSMDRGEGRLLTLEALFIKEIAPVLNTKDEYRSRTLTLKF